MNILVIGSGGREHTLAWKLNQSNNCSNLYVAPGNAGTNGIAINLEISVLDFEAIKENVIKYNIHLVIVGPEDPLVQGIVDYFSDDTTLKDIMIIGPSQEGAGGRIPDGARTELLGGRSRSDLRSQPEAPRGRPRDRRLRTERRSRDL